MSQHDNHLRDAEFSERALAFAADYAAFALGWAATLKVLAPGTPLMQNENGSVVALLWTALFVVYQAFLSCEGRVTLGKKLVGLRVVRGDDEPLDLSHGLVRAVAYLPSSFMSLGFLWALLDPNGRSWHDLAAGSRVAALRPLGHGRRTFSRLATGMMIAGFAALWGWRNIWEPRYLKLMTVADANVGLHEVRALEETYHLRHGKYATDLISLAAVSVDPRGFLRDTAALYDLKTFRFAATKDGYEVAARANDVDHTLVAAVGP